jgi:hypothetical protein
MMILDALAKHLLGEILGRNQVLVARGAAVKNSPLEIYDSIDQGMMRTTVFCLNVEYAVADTHICIKSGAQRGHILSVFSLKFNKKLIVFGGVYLTDVR